jgi:ABC-2 type transport system ATP-binding protein
VDRTRTHRSSPSPHGDAIIVTENLRRDFGETVAVRNLNLRVNRGELFGLVGPDGAGKTTTLRMFTGILEPTSGGLWVDGISVQDNPETIKDHIAYMPQRFGLYQDLTVMENLIFYADLFRVPHKDRPPRIERMFAFSRLGPFKDRPAGALSGGMKQKLGLACALIHSPRLLLLDEPTNGVDPVSRRDFWKILYELLKEGISIVVSTAYLDESERTGRVGLMYRGELIRLGEPHELKELVQGVMLEVVPSDVLASRKALAGVPEILGMHVFGGSLHVRVVSEQDAGTIRQRLEERDLRVRRLKRIAPTMEDAFLWLVEAAATTEGPLGQGQDGQERGKPVAE